MPTAATATHATRRCQRLEAIQPRPTEEMNTALAAFDQAIPSLKTMRNVGEHFDDYAVDDPKRRHRKVSRSQLQVGSWSETTRYWLDHELNADDAVTAAKKLFQAIKSADANYAAGQRVQKVVQAEPVQGEET
jgi:hypothetical protein